MAFSSADTIFALSSGSLPSGVAVIRLSGPHCRDVMHRLALGEFHPRKLHLHDLLDPIGNKLIDRGLCVFFPGPNSFTGEDCLELHLHGGRAVVSKMFEVLSSLDGLRFAEAGEFSRRAFENGKLDLTEVEALGDLIAADTEAQRVQALVNAGGRFRDRLAEWRSQLIRYRAFLEVEFDFSDEDDVPDSMVDTVGAGIVSLGKVIGSYLDDGNRGEIVRDGFVVVLTGAPNSGKSSLLNALAGRDVAIVSNRAGTTRDVLECRIDIEGVPVIFIDTAGIRETMDDIELEGIRRALERSKHADLTIWLSPLEDPAAPDISLVNPVVFVSKDDSAVIADQLSLSVVAPGGLAKLIGFLKERLEDQQVFREPALITRSRHRRELLRCRDHLEQASRLISSNSVLASEELRMASDCLGRISGLVDVEDLLDVIFSEFCIGK